MLKQRIFILFLYALGNLSQFSGDAYTITSIPLTKVTHLSKMEATTSHLILKRYPKRTSPSQLHSRKSSSLYSSVSSETKSNEEFRASQNKTKFLIAIPMLAFLLLAKKLISIHSHILFQDSTYILSFILFLAGFGVTLERNTTIGKALSAPLATMTLALVVANLGFAPFSSPLYNIVNRSLVPLAVPLLLFDSDLRRVLSDTGTLLIAFFVGAFSTIIGTLATFPLFPLSSLGNNEGWKIASALAARHIGGAVNFVAVAETLDVSGSSITAAIAADNVVVALYFAFLFSISKSGMDEDKGKDVPSSHLNEGAVNLPIDAEDLSSLDPQTSNISLSTLSTSLAVSSLFVFLGGVLTRFLFPSGTSSLPLISVLTVTSATMFPSFFRKLRSTGTAIGILFMQMFFAVSGLGGSIELVLRKAPSLFLFSTMQIGVHFITLMGIGKYVFKLPSKELYLASNANVGGPTTAAAMAQAKDWTRLILPALLIGILGYASATPIALALGTFLTRLPTIS